jgi:hypothetical protein
VFLTCGGFGCAPLSVGLVLLRNGPRHRKGGPLTVPGHKRWCGRPGPWSTRWCREAVGLSSPGGVPRCRQDGLDQSDGGGPRRDPIPGRGVGGGLRARPEVVHGVAKLGSGVDLGGVHDGGRRPSRGHVPEASRPELGDELQRGGGAAQGTGGRLAMCEPAPDRCLRLRACVPAPAGPPEHAARCRAIAFDGRRGDGLQVVRRDRCEMLHLPRSAGRSVFVLRGAGALDRARFAETRHSTSLVATSPPASVLTLS